MDRNELAALTKKQDATMMELMVSSLAAKAVKDGDQNRIKFLVERIAGKVPDQIEWTGDAPAGSTNISHALVFNTIQEMRARKKEGG
jgi:hypothetical protein